jgi:hypothetical protein
MIRIQVLEAQKLKDPTDPEHCTVLYGTFSLAHLSSSPMSTESSNSSTTLFAPNPKINNFDMKKLAWSSDDLPNKDMNG